MFYSLKSHKNEKNRFSNGKEIKTSGEKNTRQPIYTTPSPQCPQGGWPRPTLGCARLTDSGSKLRSLLFGTKKVPAINSVSWLLTPDFWLRSCSIYMSSTLWSSSQAHSTPSETCWSSVAPKGWHSHPSKGFLLPQTLKGRYTSLRRKK